MAFVLDSGTTPGRIGLLPSPIPLPHYPNTGGGYPNIGVPVANPPVPASAPIAAPQPAAPSPFMHDPSVLAAQNNLTTGNADIDAQLKEARRQAILGFGDSALASMAGFGLDPQDAAFARQNYLSGNATLARLDKAHELRRKAVIDRLAGRGMLFSGDTGYLEGQEGQQYGNEVYDARQNVLNYLLQLSQNSLQQRQSLRNMLNQSMQGAIGNYISNPAAYLGLFGNQGS